MGHLSEAWDTDRCHFKGYGLDDEISYPHNFAYDKVILEGKIYIKNYLVRVHNFFL